MQDAAANVDIDDLGGSADQLQQLDDFAVCPASPARMPSAPPPSSLRPRHLDIPTSALQVIPRRFRISGKHLPIA